MSKVNELEFSKLLFEYYNTTLQEQQKSWFAVDGKELKGSIEKGSKRGLAVVQLVKHANRSVVAQNFYNGKKESEVPKVRALLSSSGLHKQKISMDALHLKPETLKGINLAGGKFLVGLKKNQKELYEDMLHCPNYLSASSEHKTYEKGHGRLEERHYYSYNVGAEYFDPRWQEVNFQTLVKVHRKRKIVKTGAQTEETSYYLSNIETKNVESKHELFDAVRKHWQVEVNNNIRDVVLQEDKLCVKNSDTAKTIACARTLVINILMQRNCDNRNEQLDYFSDHYDHCLHWLRSIGFL